MVTDYDTSTIIPSSVKYIFFDWGGTIGRPKSRYKLINGKLNEALYSDSLYTLNELKKKYKLGIISNTSINVNILKKTFEKYKLNLLFDVIIHSSEYNFEKPDHRIFQLAKKIMEEKQKNKIKENEIAYVGNKYYKDIFPTQELKWYSFHIVRTKDENKNSKNHLLNIKKYNFEPLTYFSIKKISNLL